MTTIKRRPPPGRLAGMVDGVTRGTLDQIAARAELHLKTARKDFEREAAGLVKAMAAVARDEAVADSDKVERLYDLAGQLLDIAGALELEAFGEAAYAFCALLDRLRRAGRWDLSRVAVFVDALRRLQGERADPAGAAKMVQGLKRLAAVPV